MDWVERIGRRLKLRDVNILLAVVEAGSMARAAERLAISQPVVSKTIANLERILGVRLLDRSRLGAEPTPYGRALLRHGLAAFDELRQGVKEIEGLADPTAGEVQVGATEAMAAGLLPVVIDGLYSRYPRVTVSITQAPTGTTLYQGLRERTVDLILGRLLNPLEPDLNTEILFDDPQCVVAGKQSPWVKRRQIGLAELIQEPWVLPLSGTPARALFDNAFRAGGLEIPQRVAACNSMQMYNALLATGNFLTMLPRSVLHFGGKQFPIKILPVKLMTQPGPVGITTLQNRTLNPVADLFIGAVREIATSMTERSA
jgi:DNA-binding transcriptional LysR family regulator